MGILGIGVHHTSELDGIAVEISRVDLDDGPVIGITLAAAADADVDGRREDDMTQCEGLSPAAW
jgi:hypothetical protein